MEEQPNTPKEEEYHRGEVGGIFPASFQELL